MSHGGKLFGVPRNLHRGTEFVSEFRVTFKGDALRSGSLVCVIFVPGKDVSGCPLYTPPRAFLQRMHIDIIDVIMINAFVQRTLAAPLFSYTCMLLCFRTRVLYICIPVWSIPSSRTPKPEKEGTRTASYPANTLRLLAPCTLPFCKDCM
jgi:hypothetical protein